MTETERINEEIGGLKRKITGWLTEIAARQAYRDKLEEKRKALRSKAHRNGDQRAGRELADLRQSLSVIDLELQDLREEINDTEAEIKLLQGAKEEAFKQECLEEAEREENLAVEDAKAMIVFWQGFKELWRPHRDRLLRITRLREQAGRPRQTDTRHLWRCLDSYLHDLDGSTKPKPFYVDPGMSTYRKPYNEVLRKVFRGTQVEANGKKAEQRHENEPATNEEKKLEGECDETDTRSSDDTAIPT